MKAWRKKKLIMYPNPEQEIQETERRLQPPKLADVRNKSRSWQVKEKENGASEAFQISGINNNAALHAANNRRRVCVCVWESSVAQRWCVVSVCDWSTLLFSHCDHDPGSVSALLQRSQMWEKVCQTPSCNFTSRTGRRARFKPTVLQPHHHYTRCVSEWLPPNLSNDQ